MTLETATNATNKRTKTVKTLSSLLSATSLLMCSTTLANAQSIDYEGLSEMFGEPITASVNGKPLLASQAPASTTIITQEEILRTGATNLGGVLANLVGVDVNQYTASQYEVSVRGGNQPFNPRLLVLVDGKQVYLDHYGLTNWSGLGIELADIQQVEVIRGPNSALFGFNAAAGVINIITRNALTETYIQAEGSVGIDNVINASGSGAFKLHDRIGVRVSAGYQQQDPFDSPLDYDEDTRKAASAELRGKTTDQSQLNVGFSYSDTLQTSVTPDYGFGQLQTKTTTTHLKYAIDASWGVTELFTHYNTLEQSFDLDGTRQTAPESVVNNSIFLARLQNLARLGSRNTLRTAVEYRHNEYETDPDVSGGVKYDLFAASAMFESKLTEALTVTAAVRIDHLELGQTGTVFPLASFGAEDFDRSMTEPSFNGGIVWAINDKQRARINFGRGVQVPSLVTFGIVVPFPAPSSPVGLGLISGDPANAPTIVWSYEAGYSHNIDFISGGISATAFYIQNKDVTTSPGGISVPETSVTGIPVGQITNRGDYKSYGIELEINGQVGDRFSWGLNYTFNEIDGDFIAFTSDPIQITDFLDSGTPRHKVNAQMGYQIGAFRVDLFGRLRSETETGLVNVTTPVNFDLVQRPTHVSIDTQIAYEMAPSVELFASAQNLTGTSAAGLSPLDAQSRVRFGIRGAF